MASAPAADDKPAKHVKKTTSNKKEVGVKGDTLKQIQSRAFKHASKTAADDGLNEAEVKIARRLAYKRATEEWYALQVAASV